MYNKKKEYLVFHNFQLVNCSGVFAVEFFHPKYEHKWIMNPDIVDKFHIQCEFIVSIGNGELRE